MRNRLLPLLLFVLVISVLMSCKDKTNTNPTDAPPLTDTTTVMGYNILSKLPGIWDGPVTSTTALGSYPEWIVDLRPISGAQVSSKNELDTVNSILMSFFIAKHDKKYKMAFRNGGGFAGMNRISYAVVDSVSETPGQAYYRFSDFQAGSNRVYTEVLFKQDSLIMTVYTNKNNTLTTPTIHMNWRAKLQDTTSTDSAIAHFNFPKKILVKDLSTTFDSRPDAVYYNIADDPYPEDSQPYFGKTHINIAFGNGLSGSASNKIILIVTTQPLFSGFTFLPGNLIYRSRYVLLNGNSTGFTFTSMHPGHYYLYALYDKNGDGNFSSGDYISSNLNNPFTLAEKGNTTASTTIDYVIP